MTLADALNEAAKWRLIVKRVTDELKMDPEATADEICERIQGNLQGGVAYMHALIETEGVAEDVDDDLGILEGRIIKHQNAMLRDVKKLRKKLEQIR